MRIFLYICLNSDWSPMGLYKHVGLLWVSDQAYLSPVKHVEVSDHAFRSSMGLRLYIINIKIKKNLVLLRI